MRDFADTIKRIIAIIPDSVIYNTVPLKYDLAIMAHAARFAPPEWCRDKWRDLETLLKERIPEITEPWQEVVADIMRGKIKEK